MDSPPPVRAGAQLNVRIVRQAGPALRSGLTGLVQQVAARGGAVGWLTVPPPAEVQTWLDTLLDSGARLAVAERDGELLGCGAWRRFDGAALGRMAELKKLMTMPAARGQGVGRAVVEVLVEDAADVGVELLTLECRGNNHAALARYASLGFVVTGRRPDAVAVGDERFDQMLLHRDLRTGPSGLLRHGGRREGPGCS